MSLKLSYFLIPGLRSKKKIGFTEALAVRVLKELSIIYDIPVESIIAKGRFMKQIYVRHLFTYWCRETFGQTSSGTFKAIGAVLNRDHTTIMNCNSEFYSWLQSDMDVPHQVTSEYKTVREDYHQTCKILNQCL